MSENKRQHYVPQNYLREFSTDGECIGIFLVESGKCVEKPAPINRYICPNTILAHWIYLFAAAIVLAIAYVLFMRKYYHLHEEYLQAIEDTRSSRA